MKHSKLRKYIVERIIHLFQQVMKNIFCFGNNRYGQLGLGDIENRIYPVQLKLPSNSPIKYFAKSYSNIKVWKF